MGTCSLVRRPAVLRGAAALAMLLLFAFAPSLAAASAGIDELPRPSYANSIVISLEHLPLDTPEVDYIKANFNFGLYAWLSFSITGLAPSLAWQSDWADASAGIATFKAYVDAYLQAAKAKQARLHLVLIDGLTRYRDVYHAAKDEDIRNAQWFNDNKLCADAHIGDSAAALDNYIWGTLSRYARKMRANLEAKGRAALAFLRQRMTEEPETLVALSGWGEAELSFERIDHTKSVQDWVCDYSPFAVLEFRDWIQHGGMYDDASGAFPGQGYTGGGAKYQGASGLALFNADFGQSFTSWDLEYYNWSLADDYDTVPADATNNDPHRLPFSAYVHGGMMPAAGAAYIPGGFDPPRTPVPGNAYWDLWNTFREALVRHFIRDMAQWASEAGIPSDRWYSHQIPADYLNGTNPAMMPNLNPRYFSSASPLTTANIAPYGSAGGTIYDIRFPDYFVRTTDFGVPAIAALSPNWALMEYDAETYPQGLTVPESSPAAILGQFMRDYGYRPHLINFFSWLDPTDEHRIKGKNKEIALRNFIETVRDLARGTNTAVVFDPPVVTGFSGAYAPVPGVIRLSVTGKIWSDLAWDWKTWGGFSHFEVFRGTAPNVPADSAHRIGTTTDYFYDDAATAAGRAYFYRLRAVNTKSVAGPVSSEIMVYPAVGNFPVLSVDKTALDFGASLPGAPPPAQKVVLRNLGPPGTAINWSASTNRAWLTVSPAAGAGGSVLSVGVNATGLAAGTYTGTVSVADPAAFNSPQAIAVKLVVFASGSDAVPFGYFDTPAGGATVMGSIPVSGWALDDIGVDRVEIKRDPVAGDPPAAIGPDGLVYLGTATFVKGARPDVEAAWPGYPDSDRAGWGFMLLTYGLPAQGNGPFRLHALATDMGGKVKELGFKNIIGDNAHNTLPFGAIDTPTQGGTASGSAFVNFGWALTPLPKEIPRNGSTLTVFVDSVPIGSPTYNNFRADVRDAFPEYVNSDGAVGFRYIDTTAYADGLHTIAWSARDNAGAEGGIGSRYFWIQNLSGRGTEGLRKSSGPKNAGGTGGPGEAGLPVDSSGRLGLEVLGPAERSISQTGYAIVMLSGRGGRRFIGWGADPSKGLPVGSTLDAKNGIFYWLPAPGFLGTYSLNFAVTDGRLRSRPVTVKITVR